MKNTVLEKVPFDFPVEIRKLVEVTGEFHVVGYAATSDFDLQGDVISEEALKNSSFDLLKNSTVLLNHDIKQPIGRVTKAELDQHGLLIDVLISKTEPDVIQKIKEGVLNKFSIRGQVLEREKKYLAQLDRVVNVIKKMSLVEVSLVSVPANPEARAIGWYISKAIEESDALLKGETPMNKDEATPEKQPEKDTVPPETPSKEPEAPAPEKKQTEEKPGGEKPETAPPEPTPEQVKKTESPPDPRSEIKKKNGQEIYFEVIGSLVDRLIEMGGETASLAFQLKGLFGLIIGDAYPRPADAPLPKGSAVPGDSPGALSKDETARIISDEVKKQVDIALKNIPTLRKGLTPPEPEEGDLKKTFEGLSPEKKLKVVLALQGQSTQQS